MFVQQMQLQRRQVIHAAHCIAGRPAAQKIGSHIKRYDGKGLEYKVTNTAMGKLTLKITENRVAKRIVPDYCPGSVRQTGRRLRLRQLSGDANATGCDGTAAYQNV